MRGEYINKRGEGEGDAHSRAAVRCWNCCIHADIVGTVPRAANRDPRRSVKCNPGLAWFQIKLQVLSFPYFRIYNTVKTFRKCPCNFIQSRPDAYATKWYTCISHVAGSDCAPAGAALRARPLDGIGPITRRRRCPRFLNAKPSALANTQKTRSVDPCRPVVMARLPWALA